MLHSHRVDECYVPSDVLNRAARARGLKESQIIQYGLPVRKGFWDTVDSKSKKQPKQSLQERRYIRESLRQDLGLDVSVPTVLVVGGGDGMGGIVDISKTLGQKLGSADAAAATKSQLVIVCGNNKEAKERLEQVSTAEWGPNVKVYVKGFVNNMDEWMKASDALVTKAGPGTIAEASICGLPCMMFSFLPGQEEGNIPFVEKAGFGKYSGDADVIAATVSSWLASPEKLQQMQEAALQAARPHSTLDIAEDLATRAFAQKAKQAEREKVLVQARR
jgi:1,2-diacylglycerol 3-beta-galactosyltransferase